MSQLADRNVVLYPTYQEQVVVLNKHIHTQDGYGWDHPRINSFACQVTSFIF